MKYRKPGNRPLDITGEIETLGGDRPFIYMITSRRPTTRMRIEVDSEDIVKQFIPYLYKTVRAQFIKGCVFVTLLTPNTDTK